MQKNDVQRILNYIDSQQMGFITDVDVMETLRELCAAELEGGQTSDDITVIELGDDEVLHLRRMLQHPTAVDSPDCFETREWLLDEALPAPPAPKPPFQFDRTAVYDDDNDIPF